MQKPWIYDHGQTTDQWAMTAQTTVSEPLGTEAAAGKRGSEAHMTGWSPDLEWRQEDGGKAGEGDGSAGEKGWRR